MKKISIFLIALTTISCSNYKKNNLDTASEEKTTQNVLEGTWILKSVLSGDIMDTPCGIENNVEINIVFEAQKEGEKNINFSGQSSVNSFSGSCTILSFDEKTKSGKIKFGPIASTKMASIAKEYQDCENRYFSILQVTEDFTIKNNKLELIKSIPMSKSDIENGTFNEGNNLILFFDKK